MYSALVIYKYPNSCLTFKITYINFDNLPDRLNIMKLYFNFKANFPKENLTNPTDRSKWVKENLQTVQKNYLDGINIDFEDFIDENRTDQRDGYTTLVNETFQTFKQANKNYQVKLKRSQKASLITKPWFSQNSRGDVKQ